MPADPTTYGKNREVDRATLKGEQLPGGEADAKVILVARLIKPDSQTYSIKLELANPGGIIPSGIRVTVSFP